MNGSQHLQKHGLDLRKAAIFSLIAVAYIYTVKLIDTLYYGIFAHPVAAQTVAGLSLLAGLAQMLFFIAVIRQYASHGKPIIKIGAWLSVIGSTVALLPKLLAMNLSLSSPASLWFEYSANIGAFCFWMPCGIASNRFG